MANRLAVRTVLGGERAVTNTCTQNNYKFEGKERDPETSTLPGNANGNDDFGARYYSNRYGRWLSADWSSTPVAVPYANLSNPQTLNLYAIVSDDPESFADLDGHCIEDGCVVEGIIVGIAVVAWGIHELHSWYKEREKAEDDAFQKSMGCMGSNASCSNSEIRSDDKERLNTYGEGAVQAIQNTVPSAAPSTEIKDVVIDQLKGAVIDKMVDSAKDRSAKKDNPDQRKKNRNLGTDGTFPANV